MIRSFFQSNVRKCLNQSQIQTLTTIRKNHVNAIKNPPKILITGKILFLTIFKIIIYLKICIKDFNIRQLKYINNSYIVDN